MPHRNTTTTTTTASDLEMADKSESELLPTRSATSEQIRKFFTRFLSTTTTVALDENKASEIANHWPQEATGVQLWTFSLQTYCDIFDEENGILLWSHIHSVTEDDRKIIFQIMMPKRRPTKIERYILLCLFLFMSLFTGWIGSYGGPGSGRVRFSSVMFFTFACWLWFKY